LELIFFFFSLFDKDEVTGRQPPESNESNPLNGDGAPDLILTIPVLFSDDDDDDDNDIVESSSASGYANFFFFPLRLFHYLLIIY
jgi:hypothetical protein